MELNFLQCSLNEEFLAPTVDTIVSTQKIDGSIPWFEGGIIDPWSQVENAMALDIGNRVVEAKYAYRWLEEMQLDDGSWYASYQDGRPVDTTKVSHFVSYIATGVWHHYLVSRDISFLQRMWPMVQAAIDFVLEMRGPAGEFYWARNPKGIIHPLELLTGSSSTYLSIKSALSIASELDEEKTCWIAAGLDLAKAIQDKYQAVDLSSDDKLGFAMDWYYPILSGVITGDAAKEQLYGNWESFVVQGLGSLCNLEQQWVTAAETSELIIALAVSGEYENAGTVFNWLQQMRDEDGAYWYGIAIPQRVFWPQQKPTWTSAAVVLAADMLRPISPTSLLLNHSGLIAP